MANGQMGTVLRFLRHLVGPNETGDQTDGQLLERFSTCRDAAAFEALVQRHARLVWAVCRRILRNEHEAEDAFQATFLVLVKKASVLDGRDSLGNWLYTVAYHIALKARMKTARQPTQAKEAADMVQIDPNRDSEELGAVLDEEIHRLPAKYRGPLVLCCLQGKTNEEAARELGYPAGSMSRHLSRARDLLRERLTHRGVALAPAVLGAALAESAQAAVPPSVLQATIQAGLACAAGQTVAGAFSAEAVALAEGFLKATWLTHLKVAAVVLLTLGLLGTGAGVLAHRSPKNETRESPAVASAAGAPAGSGLAGSVEKTVRDWQPTADERRLDQIGWARDLRQAKQLALQYQRPIFLYVHGGGMATARCDGGAAHMRASALSNPNVIGLLNRCFVPVYLNTDDYRANGPVPAEERAELQRTRQEVFHAKLQFGSQWAVILAPDGEPLFGYHGCKAATAGNMIEFLEWYAQEYPTGHGETLVAPRPQNRPPAAAADALVLHLTARYLQRRGADLVPFAIRPGEDNTYSWRTNPAENWIVLDRAAWSRLLPPAEPGLGSRWTVDRDASDQILRHFYPQTEDNDLTKNRIDRGELRATVMAASANLLRIQIEGELRMKHCFTPGRDDDRFVEATVLGLLDYDRTQQRVRELRLVTPRATYGTDPFGVAVRSLP